ncbi:hypothetical protein [Microbulbifer magnicolonia]|uniref:hypothetical protein n=1 Tax=Microbulbifer magnicolonia TaxID=3109744 RepID=UPI002B407BDD|nr:hypothetical protein [Microbulbifer sp. GG15]
MNPQLIQSAAIELERLLQKYAAEYEQAGIAQEKYASLLDRAKHGTITSPTSELPAVGTGEY